jgi:membrane protein implicated in regulation of membrane protease activity
MRYRLLGAAVLAVVISTGCATTTVNKVLADPSRYRTRDVTLSGQVTESISVADRGAYRLDDRTGQIWIVSSHGVPRKGARVKVSGQVKEGFNLGTAAERFNLPRGIGSGLVVLESSHSVKR